VTILVKESLVLEENDPLTKLHTNLHVK